jgi:hypothetical protein
LPHFCARVRELAIPGRSGAENRACCHVRANTVGRDERCRVLHRQARSNDRHSRPPPWSSFRPPRGKGWPMTETCRYCERRERLPEAVRSGYRGEGQGERRRRPARSERSGRSRRNSAPEFGRRRTRDHSGQTPATRADGDGSPGLSPWRLPPVRGILTQWYRAGPEAELRADLDRSDSGAQAIHNPRRCIEALPLPTLIIYSIDLLWVRSGSPFWLAIARTIESSLTNETPIWGVYATNPSSWSR